MEDNRISVVINTYNAAEHLDAVLTAVSGFDETVVCDMESTDSTLDIARRHGCRIVTFPKGQHQIVEPARTFAVQSATCPWVLVVDADEIVTPQLRDYLYARVGRGDCPAGLYIPRRNRFMSRPIHSSADYQLRLLRREGTSWPEYIHSTPVVAGTTAKIPTGLEGVYIDHLADETVAEMVDKNNRYTDYEAAKKLQRNFGPAALVLRPLWTFLRSYLLLGAIRDGRRGLIRCGLKAYYQFVLVAKVMESRLQAGQDQHTH